MAMGMGVGIQYNRMQVQSQGNNVNYNSGYYNPGYYDSYSNPYNYSGPGGTIVPYGSGGSGGALFIPQPNMAELYSRSFNTIDTRPLDAMLAARGANIFGQSNNNINYSNGMDGMNGTNGMAVPNSPYANNNGNFFIDGGNSEVNNVQKTELTPEEQKKAEEKAVNDALKSLKMKTEISNLARALEKGSGDSAYKKINELMKMIIADNPQLKNDPQAQKAILQELYRTVNGSDLLDDIESSKISGDFMAGAKSLFKGDSKSKNDLTNYLTGEDKTTGQKNLNRAGTIGTAAATGAAGGAVIGTFITPGIGTAIGAAIGAGAGAVGGCLRQFFKKSTISN